MENEIKPGGRPDEKKKTALPESPGDSRNAEAKVKQSPAPPPGASTSGEGGPARSKGPKISIEWITAISIVLTLLVSSLITAWYQERAVESGSSTAPGTIVKREGVEYINIKVFYPSLNGLVPEDREVEKADLKRFMVEAAVNEYFKGPSGDVPSYVPEGTKLLGIFQGSDGIIYLDISHEFRSRFKGDAYGEFLLLRGLYESVMSNAQDVSGLKVLIEGQEVETIGGHISLKGTLGSVITSTMVKDSGSK